MTSLTLPKADHFGADRSSSPHWNESVWFSISVPEEKIHGMIQYYFRPNMNMLNGGPILWDPTGLRQFDCLYYNWGHLQPMPADAEKFNMKTINSLRVEVVEPMARYKIDYDYNGFFLDLEWNAIGPDHELHTSDPGQQKTAAFHIEQPGRLKGVLRCRDREWAIDCFSMRDTSYGVREYAALSSGGYFWGIAGTSSFHAIAMGEGRDGVPQDVVGGYLFRDGTLSSLAFGTREILEFGQYGPKKVHFCATDKLGRSVSALGEIDEGFVWTGYTDHTVVWSLTNWDVEGVPHLGDNQEFCSAVRFRKIARGRIKLA